jgi:hypothetical protein
MSAHGSEQEAAAGGMPARITPVLVLSAVERAERQRPSPPPTGPPGVTLGEILDHLAAPRRSATAREVRATLAALADEAAVEHARRRGVGVFTLAARGRRRLTQARRGRGASPVLPESPQHRAWREARELSARALPVMRARLQATLAATATALDNDQSERSDTWLALAERLRGEARAIGCALHCLRDWPEPVEAGPDVEDLREPGDELLGAAARAAMRGLRSGRRNPRTWLC